MVATNYKVETEIRTFVFVTNHAFILPQKLQTRRQYDFASDRLCTQVISCSQKSSQQQIQYKLEMCTTGKQALLDLLVCVVLFCLT